MRKTIEKELLTAAEFPCLFHVTKSHVSPFGMNRETGIR